MRSAAADRAFESLAPGERVSFEHTVSENDIAAFADLSGDYNPLHMDEGYAASSTFGRRVLHGMFLGALVSRLVGMHLPGKSALLMKETLEFRKPVFIGDTVFVSGTLSHVSAATKILKIAIDIRRADEQVTLGEAHVQML